MLCQSQQRDYSCDSRQNRDTVQIFSDTEIPSLAREILLTEKGLTPKMPLVDLMKKIQASHRGFGNLTASENKVTASQESACDEKKSKRRKGKKNKSKGQIMAVQMLTNVLTQPLISGLCGANCWESGHFRPSCHKRLRNSPYWTRVLCPLRVPDLWTHRQASVCTILFTIILQLILLMNVIL